MVAGFYSFLYLFIRIFFFRNICGFFNEMNKINHVKILNFDFIHCYFCPHGTTLSGKVLLDNPVSRRSWSRMDGVDTIHVQRKIKRSEEKGGGGGGGEEEEGGGGEV